MCKKHLGNPKTNFSNHIENIVGKNCENCFFRYKVIQYFNAQKSVLCKMYIQCEIILVQIQYVEFSFHKACIETNQTRHGSKEYASYRLKIRCLVFGKLYSLKYEAVYIASWLFPNSKTVTPKIALCGSPLSSLKTDAMDNTQLQERFIYIQFIMSMVLLLIVGPQLYFTQIQLHIIFKRM